MTIKAVIFDLGGVIIDIDYEKTVEAFTNLGAHKFKEIFSQFKQSDVFDLYETGRIQCDEFRQRLCQELEIEISNEQFDNAWNAMLGSIPKEGLTYISALKEQGYKTYLYSNTNPIHLKKVLDILQKDTGHTNFDDFFDRQFYSHEYGKRKPHVDSFTTLARDIKLSPDEIIFIDDTSIHVNGAKDTGIHAYLIDKKRTMFHIQDIVDELTITTSPHEGVNQVVGE